MELQQNPKVSILSPNYNNAKFLREMVHSVMMQDYPNIELILVDDGSTDNSKEIILELQSKYPQKIITHFQENQGICGAINSAFKLANGEYCAFLATDDIILPYKTRLQVEFLENNPLYTVVSGSYMSIDEKNNILAWKFKEFSKSGENKKDATEGCIAMALTCMLRTSALKEMGPFPRDIANEDWYWELKFKSMGYRFYHMNCLFSQYRIHGTNSHKKYLFSLEQKNKLSKYFPEPITKKIQHAAFNQTLMTMVRYGDYSEFLQVIKRQPLDLLSFKLWFECFKIFTYKLRHRLAAR